MRVPAGLHIVTFTVMLIRLIHGSLYVSFPISQMERNVFVNGYIYIYTYDSFYSDVQKYS